MAQITNKNFLAPSGFKLVIDRKNFGNLEYTVQIATHGSVGLNTVEVPYQRTNIKETGDTLNYGDVTFEMIIDEDLDNYNEMHNWLRRIVQNNGQTASDRAVEAPLEVDISLMVLSSKNNTTNRIIYRNAFPVDLGVITFDASVDSVNYVTVPITFSYDYFDVV